MILVPVKVAGNGQQYWAGKGTAGSACTTGSPVMNILTVYRKPPAAYTS